MQENFLFIFVNETVCGRNTELSLGCWSSGHKNLSMYQVFAFHSVFPYHLHAHTCPLYNVLLEVVCCCFPRNNILLNMPMFVGSQSFISLPSFMFVSAVVSEIRELKEKEKKKEKKNNNSEIAI